MKIVVLVEGGLVTDVLTDVDAEVLLVDFDCQDAEEAVELELMEGLPPTPASMTETDSSVNPSRVDYFWSQIPKETEAEQG